MSLNNLKLTHFYAIDIETTGLDLKSDEIISFACFPIIEGKILVRSGYYSLIKPKMYHHKAMKYHGIGRDNLLDAPLFKEVAIDLVKLLDGILVGHTVEFDYSFLRASFKASGIKFKRDCIDIAMVERWLADKRKTEGRNLTLDGMIAAYGLKHHFRHNAAADAYFAAQIFQLQIRELMSLGIDSAKKIIKAARSCRNAFDDNLFFG